MTVEYRTEFTDPGCKARLVGSRFWKDGLTVSIPLQVVSQLNPEVLGNYTLRYTGSCLGLEASAVRKVRVVDTQCPRILLTDDPEGLEPEEHYQEAGYRALDDFDGDITSKVIRTEEPGRIIYAVTDSSGNPAYAFRRIPIYDVTPPQIHLEGGGEITLSVGTRYVEPGYTAVDAVDGNLTEAVEVVSEEILWYQPGTYTVTYSVSDSRGNEATASRRITVEAREHPMVVFPERKTIYLTFDDGPGPETARLLDVLGKYDVKATFFVVDTEYPEMIRRAAREGHSIGIHTMSHNYDQIYASPEAYFDDLLGMQQRIRELTGRETWLMRFPGGSSNTVSKISPGIMTLLTHAVEDAGFSYFDWNVDSNDAGGANNPRTVFSNVTQGIAQEEIALVLQHDIHAFSVDAVEDIILWALENGYHFQPLERTSPGMHHPVYN